MPGMASNSKFCLLCNKDGENTPLNEIHIVFDCKYLEPVQQSGGIRKYRNTFHGKDMGTLMWNFLGGDNCDTACLLRRGKVLYDLIELYKQKINEL